MKQTALRLMLAAGAFAPFRLANRRQALVLTYHRFGASDLGTFTAARAFEEQLRYLSARYRIVPLSEIAERLHAGRELPRGAAVITIDDGYRDAYEIAYPLLRKYGAPATLFAVTDFLDGRRWVWTDKLRHVFTNTAARGLTLDAGGETLRLSWEGRHTRLAAARRANSALKELPGEARDELIGRAARTLGVVLPALPPREYAPVTWDEAREMDAGGLRVESHTVTHPILTHATDEQLRAELSESRARIEAELRRPAVEFCYPNGDADARVRRAVEAAGYRAAVTTEAGLNGADADPLMLRRIHTEDDLAHFAQATSGFEGAKNLLRGARRARPAGAQTY